MGLKILFCSVNPLKRELGAARVLIDLMEELEPLGWTCHAVTPSELGQPDEGHASRSYDEALRRYLHQQGAAYDIIEYDHGHLPYPRSEFPWQTLMVARSVLLAHHFISITIPLRLKEKLSYWLRGTPYPNIETANITLREADLINVTNEDDKRELLKYDLPPEKIIVLPYGISRTRRPLFDAISSAPPPYPTVVFVGTFDSRKGANDFPSILRGIVQQVPNVSFRFLGTFRTPEYVRGFFPGELRDRIQVIPTFPTQEMPRLLADCSVGAFPSYIESFGFGVLEMLAASVPVVAYDAPGPTVMLPAEYLVPRGDAAEMARKVVRLLSNKTDLLKARGWAKQRSQAFSWPEIARQTSQIYQSQLEKKQGENPALWATKVHTDDPR